MEKKRKEREKKYVLINISKRSLILCSDYISLFKINKIKYKITLFFKVLYSTQTTKKVI